MYTGSIPYGSQWSLTFEVRKRRASKMGFRIVSQSQWSLTFEVRKRGHVGARRPGIPRVAMEPDL